MSELHLEPWKERPYGCRADGVVESHDREIEITVRKPHSWIEPSGVTVILLSGWTAGHNSMREPGIVATEFCHRSIAIEYTNTSGNPGALQHNAEDFIAVAEAEAVEQDDDQTLTAMTLSMGGGVVTIGIAELERRRQEEAKKPDVRSRIKIPEFEIIDLVNPGKYIKPEYFSKREIARRFLEEGLEILDIGRNPMTAARIGLTSVQNCARRRKAVPAELLELVDDRTVHDDLIYAKSAPRSPYVRFNLAVKDRLLPAFAQLQSIKGLPIDEVLPIEGGHGKLAYDPRISRRIFQQSAEILSARSVDKDPEPIAA